MARRSLARTERGMPAKLRSVGARQIGEYLRGVRGNECSSAAVFMKKKARPENAGLARSKWNAALLRLRLRGRRRSAAARGFLRELLLLLNQPLLLRLDLCDGLDLVLDDLLQVGLFVRRRIVELCFQAFEAFLLSSEVAVFPSDHVIGSFGRFGIREQRRMILRPGGCRLGRCRLFRRICCGGSFGLLLANKVISRRAQ